MDEILGIDENPEIFDLAKELRKLEIEKIEIRKGDVWQLGEHRLMCGDSTVEADIMKLMGGEKAAMSFTDPPYILNYLRGKKKHGKAVEGFGYKRDRRYLETDELPPDFTARWMANVERVLREDCSIIVFENWKNIPVIWGEMEKRWKIRNLIIWRVPNRVQNFSARYRFFNKFDIALLGSSGDIALNTEPEDDPLLQEEYETAVYATRGRPHWENYKKGKKICPTDFVECNASDGGELRQNLVFGTKPLSVLLPYLKVLTRRNDIVLEPFCGSGSLVLASEKLKRRCFALEKVATYCELIRRRWERFTGLKAARINP